MVDRLAKIKTFSAHLISLPNSCAHTQDKVVADGSIEDKQRKADFLTHGVERPHKAPSVSPSSSASRASHIFNVVQTSRNSCRFEIDSLFAVVFLASMRGGGGDRSQLLCAPLLSSSLFFPLGALTKSLNLRRRQPLCQGSFYSRRLSGTFCHLNLFSRIRDDRRRRQIFSSFFYFPFDCSDERNKHTNHMENCERWNKSNEVCCSQRNKSHRLLCIFA